MRRGDAPPRDRSRGVAVLEFTLSLVFLVPLLMGTLAFGYYFYIGSNVEEAARQALGEALAAATPCAPGPLCAPAVANAISASATGSGTTCIGGAAACYMNAAPLAMGGPSGNMTFTCACAIMPVNPTYTIGVTVEFEPVVQYFRSMFPAGTGTKVRYTATIAGSN